MPTGRAPRRTDASCALRRMGGRSRRSASTSHRTSRAPGPWAAVPKHTRPRLTHQETFSLQLAPLRRRFRCCIAAESACLWQARDSARPDPMRARQPAYCRPEPALCPRNLARPRPDRRTPNSPFKGLSPACGGERARPAAQLGQAFMCGGGPHLLRTHQAATKRRHFGRWANTLTSRAFNRSATSTQQTI